MRRYLTLRVMADSFKIGIMSPFYFTAFVFDFTVLVLYISSCAAVGVQTAVMMLPLMIMVCCLK